MAIALASVPPVDSPSRLNPPQPRPATLTLSSVLPSVVYSIQSPVCEGREGNPPFHLEGSGRSRMHARLLVFLVSVMAAPQALALDACFADSAGAWRGPVWNGAGLQTMDTMFQIGSDGALSGRYHIHDFIPFDGTLTELRQTGDCEADFVWRDRDGTGVVHIRFE